jgi:hypothetical protein
MSSKLIDDHETNRRHSNNNNNNNKEIRKEIVGSLAMRMYTANVIRLARQKPVSVQYNSRSHVILIAKRTENN